MAATNGRRVVFILVTTDLRYLYVFGHVDADQLDMITLSIEVFTPQ